MKNKTEKTATQIMELTKWNGLVNWQLYEKKMDWVEDALSHTIDMELVRLKNIIPTSYKALLDFDPNDSLVLYDMMIKEFKYLTENGFANHYWDKRINDFRQRISALFNIAVLYRNTAENECFKRISGKKGSSDNMIYKKLDREAGRIYSALN